MSNDTLGTVLGIIKSLLIAILSLIFKDKIAQVTGLSEAIVLLISSAWSSYSFVKGLLLGRPADKPVIGSK